MKHSIRISSAALFLFLFDSAYAANIWTGTITTTAGNRLVGTVDYEIDTTTDVMILSNKTGDWLTVFGPARAVTLYAHDDLTSTSMTIQVETSSTFDVTNAHFENGGAAGGLGAISGDGWYWASDTANVHFDVSVGGRAGSSASPINDWTGQIGQNLLGWGSTSSSGSELGSLSISFGPATLVPEPSTSALALSAFGLLFLRRRRFHP